MSKFRVINEIANGKPLGRRAAKGAAMKQLVVEEKEVDDSGSSNAQVVYDLTDASVLKEVEEEAEKKARTQQLKQIKAAKKKAERQAKKRSRMEREDQEELQTNRLDEEDDSDDEDKGEDEEEDGEDGEDEGDDDHADVELFVDAADKVDTPVTPVVARVEVGEVPDPNVEVPAVKRSRGRPKKKMGSQSNEPIPKGSSAIHCFFDKAEIEGYGSCRLHRYTPSNKHNRLVAQTGATTTNLWSHCRTWHRDLLDTIVLMHNNGEDFRAHMDNHIANLEMNSASKGLYKFYPKMEKQGGRFRKEISLLLWLVASNIPFNTIESKHFKAFLTECNVSLDSKWTIQGFLPLVYESCLEIQRKRIRDCGTFSLTFDLWTSLAGTKYLVVTYHAITSDFRSLNCALDLVPFETGAYSSFILQAMHNRMSRHKFDDCVIAAATSDSGANVKAVRCKLAEGDDESCINHLLKAVWDDVLIGGKSGPLHKQAADDIDSIATLVSYARLTPSIRQSVLDAQVREGDDPLQLIAANATRWEGRHNAVKRFFQLKDCLQSLFMKGDFEQVMVGKGVPTRDFLGDAFFNRLLAYIPVLETAHLFSKAAQEQKGINISCVIHHFFELKEKLAILPTDDEVKRTFKGAVAKAVESRLAFLVGGPTNYLKASLLDFRYAKETRNRIGSELFEECWAAIISDGLNLVQDNSKGISQKIAELTYSYVVEQLEKMTPEKGHEDKYTSQDVLEWWRNFQAEGITVIKHGARMVLCVQAGSAASEATFSHTTRDVTKLRTRMSDETLERLTVIESFLRHCEDFEFNNFIQDLQKLVRDDADLANQKLGASEKRT